MSKTYEERLQKIKEKHPEAYQSWSKAEDIRLKTSFMDGMSVQELSEQLQRQPGAIRSRLQKLGISINNPKTIMEQDASIQAPSENTSNDTEDTPSNILSRSFAPLMEKDIWVYTQLISKIQNDFFERLQPKNAIHALVDKIIEAISSTEGEDAL